MYDVHRRKHQKSPRRFVRPLILFLLFILLCSGIYYVIRSTPFSFFYLMGSGKYLNPLQTSLSLKDALGNTLSIPIVENKLRQAHIRVASVVSYADDGFLVKLESGEEIIVSSKKPIDMQISSLQLILSRFTIEGKRFTQMDLRFDRPVIVSRS